MPRFRSIDMLRGLAASAVALAHVNDRFRLGAIGVDIFFVISGFVMVHASRGKSPREFLLDRFWRIYPTYWAVAVPWILLGLGIGAISILSAAASLMLWPQWFGVYSLFIGVTWTLMFELAFYLSVAATMSLRSCVLPLILFGAAVLARPFVDNSTIAFLGHPIAVEFLLGILIASAPQHERSGLNLLMVGVLWLALVPNPWLHDIFIDADTGNALYRLLLWGVPSAFIVYGMVSQERRLDGQWTQPLLLLGAASYSIYLIHGIVVALVDLPWPAEFALAIGCGISIWRFVERPLLDRRKHNRVKRRSDFQNSDAHSAPITSNLN